MPASGGGRSAARLSDGIRCSALTAYPSAVRTRAVKLLLGEIHAPKLSERHISAVDRLLFSECPSARASLPGGFSAQREYDRLLLTAGSPTAFEPVTLLAGESAVLQPLGLRVCCEWQENFSEIQNTPSTFAVKCDTIGSTTQILFRPRRAHDEMRVSGGRKTLKKLHQPQEQNKLEEKTQMDDMDYRNALKSMQKRKQD